MRHSAKTENHVFSRFSLCLPMLVPKFSPILCVAGRFITRCKTSESQSLRVWLSVRCALSDAAALRFPAGLLRVACCALRCACRSLRLAHGVLCAALGLHWKRPGAAGRRAVSEKESGPGLPDPKAGCPLRGWYATAGRNRRFAFFTLRGTLPHADAVPPVVSAHGIRAGGRAACACLSSSALMASLSISHFGRDMWVHFRGRTSAGVSGTPAEGPDLGFPSFVLSCYTRKTHYNNVTHTQVARGPQTPFREVFYTRNAFFSLLTYFFVVL